MRQIVLSLGIVAAMLAGCGGSSGSGNPNDPTGQACNPSDLGKCGGAILYLCTSQDSGNTYTWQKNIDCSQSTTAGCTCAIIQNTPMCATGTGSNAGSCQGKSLN
jgi:hypothetical protein